MSRNKIVLYYADLDEKKEQIFENVASVKRINKGDGKLDHYLMNPSDEEFKQLLKKKLFSAEVAFRRIKIDQDFILRLSVAMNLSQKVKYKP